MFVRFVFAFALLGLVGCGSGSGHSATAARAASCTDRIMKAPTTISRGHEAAVRRYVMMTYCEPFARNGWVYSDGSLSIKAQLWLVHGGRESCSTSKPGEPSKTVPCSTLLSPGQPQMIDCAILRFVRRSEVRTYLRRLGGPARVQCDDGTRLATLGVHSS